MFVVGVLLLAAVMVVGVAGVAANIGSEHQLVGGFGIFGYHVHGSAGRLLVAGIVIGAVGMLGFILAAEGLRRNAALRRELFRFRHDARTSRGSSVPAHRAGERVLAGTAPAPSGGGEPAGAGTGRAGTATGRSGAGVGTPPGTGAGTDAERGERLDRALRPTSGPARSTDAPSDKLVD